MEVDSFCQDQLLVPSDLVHNGGLLPRDAGAGARCVCLPVTCPDGNLALKDNSVALKNNSVALKDSSVALKDNSVALKDNSVALKDNSVALKDNSVALKDNSVALKDNSVALKDNSVALKDNSVALKDNSVALVSYTSKKATASSQSVSELNWWLQRALLKYIHGDCTSMTTCMSRDLSAPIYKHTSFGQAPAPYI